MKHKFIKNAPVKSVSYDPRMFDRQPAQIIQETNIEITVNDQDDAADCLAGCFRMCFGIGKAAAK